MFLNPAAPNAGPTMTVKNAGGAVRAEFGISHHVADNGQDECWAYDNAGATLVLCHSGPADGEPGVIHPPSFPTCHVCQMYAPWQGGNVLLGDGSVRFVPTSVNLNTWAALSSMKLGDLPGDY